MPDKENDEIERDDIFGANADDDGLRDIIDQAFGDDEEDEEDTGGLDQPIDTMPTVEVDTVGEKEARDILSEAELGKGKRAKAKEEAEAKEDDVQAPDDAQEDDGEAASDDNKAPDIQSADISTLLDGIPDDRRSEVSRRVGEADRVLSQFKGKEDELNMHGTTPEKAIERMLYLNSFAQKEPAEYLAWVAKEMAGEPHAVLDAAANLLGYKLTKESDDEDMFEDPEVKELREENARLKAMRDGNAPAFGPDTPERQKIRNTAESLQGFIAERDENGQLKRPHFEPLRRRITDLVAQHFQATGEAVPVDGLQQFYDQALGEMQSALGAQPTPQGSAAHNAPSMSQQIKTQRADAAQKARRASKTLDGAGQSASRRPSISPDADLMTVIKTLGNQLSE